ncbi:MYCBP-associated protein isoform X2 [Microcaecilia unicolor]|uniref:MYCBP-associated protein isoform X2 n=1 Tax=Microcaecilia unicolor TaxID=1415580 RepID=A0A6P7YBB1_9AMPH|nr:MYCBP-associated protein isoform X2 [Microcaecilia unicolor]
MSHKAEKKRLKGIEFIPSPLVEELKSASSTVLKRSEIQGLSIKLEDLEQLHPPHHSSEQKTPVSRSFLVRKKRHQGTRKKTQFLVAYPAASDIAVKNLDYSGTDGLQFDAYGQILPHSILGSLHELKKEALARGNTQIAGLVTDSPLPGDLLFTAERKGREKRVEEQAKVSSVPLRHHGALENWKHHTALRKQQMRVLSRQLHIPANELLMSLSASYRQIQEERYIIDRTLPAVDYGKGCHVGSEFWHQAEPIGNEMSGLMTTVTQCERGYPAPFTHVGKPPGILQETDENFSFPLRKYSHKWDDSLYLLQRRDELREILKELNFTQPDIEGLEVIGKGRPFTSVSVEHFVLPEEEKKASTEKKEDIDPLWEYPDVVSEVVFGPSLQFCGKAARWVGAIASHRDEVGICARITFEVLAFERALSVLEITNDGTTAIWYEWRRLPHISTLDQIPKYQKGQRFYFNTSAGVILPGESLNFPFLFKSPNAGIFSEAWQFCTHPVLLGGASLQVSLWGIAVSEDKTYELRQVLEAELEDKQTLTLAKALVQELLEGVRSPERPLTPLDAYITEEELFHRKNPQLHYQHHIVKEIHQLWRQYIDRPPLEVDRESPQAKEEELGTNWNLSFHDFKEAAMLLPEEETREAILYQLNKSVLEMGAPPEKAQIILIYQICLQLWREVIDGLVCFSGMLRSVMGMPEKEFIVEGTVDSKRGVKGKKEDKKTSNPTDEKKASVGKEKEEKKGTVKSAGKDKEERPSSKKRKSLKPQSQVKSLSSSRESLDVEPSDPLMDPSVQEKYQENLYTEVYGLLDTLVERFVFFSEALENKTPQEQEEEEYQFLLV